MNTQLALSPTRAPGAMPPVAGKYLTFRLGHEEYGIEIVKVQEIIGLLPITKLPRQPGHVRGLINLRGHMIPTIDLRRKFGLESVTDTGKTCIVVVAAKAGDHAIHLGVVVDEVADVLNVREADVETAPQFGDHLVTRYIRGIGLVEGAVKILLDIDQVLTGEEGGLTPAALPLGN